MTTFTFLLVAATFYTVGNFSFALNLARLSVLVRTYRAIENIFKIVKKSREHARFPPESLQASRGLAVIFPFSAPPAAEGQKRQIGPFSGTFFGHPPAPSRTIPGFLPDPFRVPPGPFSIHSRTPPVAQNYENIKVFETVDLSKPCAR